jgi:transcriptional repressor NrdR
MVCPYCGHADNKVVDKRDNNDTGVTRRRRECESCGKRFTTYERVEAINLYVVKRSGKIEEFDREKLKLGIMKAIKKRNLPEGAIENMIVGIEQQLLAYDSTEIEAGKVGELVLEGLKELDELSYLRYASVYRDFQTIADFKKAIGQLESRKD